MKSSHPQTTDLGLLILRLGMGGIMFFAHGWGKLISFSERSATFPDPLGIGSYLSLAGTIGAEAGAALLIMLGFGTRLAALPLLFTMLVAALVFHADDPFQKKELALLFAIFALTLFFTGGGRYSLGAKIPVLRRWS